MQLCVLNCVSVVQFTALTLNTVVKPQGQASFDYSFMPAQPMAGRPFGLVILLNYITEVRIGSISCKLVAALIRFKNQPACYLGRNVPDGRLQPDRHHHRARGGTRRRNVSFCFYLPNTLTLQSRRHSVSILIFPHGNTSATLSLRQSQHM